MKNALLTTLALCALWFGLTDAIGTPAYIFPGPMATAQAFYDHAGILWGSFSITAGTMLLGFSAGALLGLGFGTLMALFPVAEKMLTPLIFFKQGLPSFVLAPLIILAFGIGLASKIIITALTVFFIILYGTLEGLKNTPPHLLHMAKIMGGKPALVFYHLRLKNALPTIKIAFKTAAVMAPAATIAGEWIGSTEGLGFIILHAFDRMQSGLMMAALLLCVFLGGLFSATMTFALNKLIFWRPL